MPAALDHVEAVRSGEECLADLAAPPPTLTPETSVSDAVDRFQAESRERALVLSGGEAVGLVTATDAFEAVMGEPEDPLDAAAIG